MMGSLVLQIVVENSVLDLNTINEMIRPLSKEFQVIGTKAMEEHASYHKALKKINSDFKFHFCSLCEKPHVADGSWKEDDLCSCNLDENRHAEEINRRSRLQAVGDPRLIPSFASLSTKTKTLRLTAFTGEFLSRAMRICTSGLFYRMTSFPLVRLNLARLSEWNNTAFDLLNICIFVDVLDKEFCSVGPRRTTMLDIFLQVLENPSEEERFRQLLNDDEAAIETFFGNNDEKLNELLHPVNNSFLVILSSDDDQVTLTDVKNLGNSIGTFLMEWENKARVFLGEAGIKEMLRGLPETFVWMPIYGGNREDYVPPVNQFAHYAEQS